MTTRATPLPNLNFQNRRWPLVDVARGFAIIAMILFHFTWDLGFFGIIDYDISFTPEGRLLAHSIAGSFLFIVGISLALAARNGLPIKPYLRRLRYVAGAAIIVSVGTFFTMPDDWIFFGVLHCIALSSLLALPFLRAPIVVVAAFAALSVALPFTVYHPLFDRPWLFWLGLNHVLPRTNDYVPFFRGSERCLREVLQRVWLKHALVYPHGFSAPALMH